MTTSYLLGDRIFLLLRPHGNSWVLSLGFTYTRRIDQTLVFGKVELGSIPFAIVSGFASFISVFANSQQAPE